MVDLHSIKIKVCCLMVLWQVLLLTDVKTSMAQQTNTYFIIQELTKTIHNSPLATYKQRPIILSVDAPDPVLSLIQQSMIDQGFQLFSSETSDSLLIKVLISPSLQISFLSKQKQKGRRSLQGFVVTRVMDHRDQILETYTLSIQVDDSLYAKKEQFEDDMWSLSRFSAAQKPFNRWQALLQPTLIISAITTSIYLLFNVRSR